MRIEGLDVRRFPAPFRVVFRHAAAVRSEAANVIVAARGLHGLTGYGEGCPREYVTGETQASASAFVEQHKTSFDSHVRDMKGLFAWTREHRNEIDANPAAFCAMEMAILDLLGRLEEKPMEDLLGVSRLTGAFRYSAVLGDSAMPEFQAQADWYWEAGFRDFKIKVSGDVEQDRRKLAVLTRKGEADVRIRLDANNLWADPAAAVRHLKALDARVFAVEEPLRAGDFKGMRRVADECAVRIIVDESLVRLQQLEALSGADIWIVNLRISKMGGLLRSLEVAAETFRRGIGLIVGAQVGETSLLTRVALTVMNQHRPEIIAAEGGFGTRLLERDLTEPSLTFGPDGILKVGRDLDPASPGLGLDVREDFLISAFT